ncbi:MAG: M48 family metalloprotease [Nitrospinae bacterium]|nr:M48 family metalloprotease [Nitrospinota bacterium]
MRLIKPLALLATLLIATAEAGYADDRAIGRTMAVEALTFVGPRVGDVKLNRYVSLVGGAVASFSDTPGIAWRFAVVNSQEASSFSTPGGYVFVTTGLISRLKSEAQLAGILGHEIAHVTRRHIAVAMEGKAGKLKPADAVLSLLFAEGLEKEKEFEADSLGMKFAALAGYDPNGLYDALVKIREIEGKGKSVYFVTHPLIALRLTALEKEAKLYPKKGKTLKERFEAIVN